MLSLAAAPSEVAVLARDQLIIPRYRMVAAAARRPSKNSCRPSAWLYVRFLILTQLVASGV